MHEQIKNQIKDAMRAKDTIRLEVLRGLSALFTNALIVKGGTSLPDEDVTAIIRRSVKQRKDSIDQFEKGGRADLVEKEKAELIILESFLPKLMSREEIEKFVSAKIAAALATSGTSGISTGIDKAKIGQFIGQIMKDLKGKADGTDVKAVVEKLIQ